MSTDRPFGGVDSDPWKCLMKAVIRAIVPARLRMAIYEARQRWRVDLSRWASDHLVPDRVIWERQFQQAFGRPLNFAAPTTFNEKIHWLMRYDRRPILTQLADKYAVRAYVEDRAGLDLLNDLYGVWNDPSEIEFEKLPKSFVLKVNHGSGQNIFCRDKAQLNLDQTRRRLAAWMKRSEYWVSREWAYKEIPPRILCERLLTDEFGASPPDFKFFCFDGEPRLIQVDTDRFTAHHRDLFDLDWQPLPFSLEFPSCGRAVPRPPQLEVMTAAARTLSQGFTFIRVDLYAIGERVIFGELTCYPEGGIGHFRPESYDQVVGKWIVLPNLRRETVGMKPM